MTTLVTNNAFATLAANIGPASTSLTVASGQGARFPAPGTGEQAFLTLVIAASGVSEIVKYTTRSGDVFSNVTRAQDGTSAQSFTIGDAVELRVVAANYNADGILPNQTSANGKFLKSVSLVATWTQITNTDVSGLGTLATQNGTFSGTSSGNNTGDQTITLTGDVTGTGTGSFPATIGANKVTLAQMAQIATARIMGRVTAATGNVEVLTVAQVKTLLAYVASEITGLALVATTGQAGDLTGTLSTAQLPALSGDVSNPAGSGVTAIGANKVTLGQMAQVASSTVLGRLSPSTGNVEVLSALPAAVLPAYTGDVTKPGGSTVTTIANNVVSPAKMSTVAASTFLGRVTVGIGNVEVLTAAQAKTILGITGSDITGLAAIATSGSANDLIAGTLPTARVPAFTGDVTNTAGSLATTIANNVVSFAKMAQIATARFLGRVTAGTGNVEELTAAQAKTALAITNTDVSGLGTLATQNGTFSGTHSGNTTNTNTGDQTIALTGDVTGAGTGTFAATIAANAVTFAKMQQITGPSMLGRPLGGTGAVVAVGTVPDAMIPALTGDVTTPGGSVATTISANAVSLAKLAQMATASFHGRLTAGTGNVEVLSAAQAKSVLAIAQADVTGLKTSDSPTFAGVTVTGATTFKDNVWLDVTGPVPSLIFSKNASLRWQLISAGAESSGNAGSNLILYSFSDAGTFLFNPLMFERSTNTTYLSGAVSIAGGGYVAGDWTVNNNFSVTALSTLSGGVNTTNISATGAITGANANFTGGAVTVDSGSSGAASLYFKRNSLSRWQWGMATGTESGGNVGSDLALYVFDDTGAYIETALSFQRSTRNATFTKAMSVQGMAYLNAGATAKMFTQTPYLWSGSGALNLNYLEGQSWVITLTASSSIASIANIPAGSILRIVFILGAYNITSWPSSVKWVGGTAPNLTAGTLKRAVVVVENDGTYLLASSGAY